MSSLLAVLAALAATGTGSGVGQVQAGFLSNIGDSLVHARVARPAINVVMMAKKGKKKAGSKKARAQVKTASTAAGVMEPETEAKMEPEVPEAVAPAEELLLGPVIADIDEEAWDKYRLPSGTQHPEALVSLRQNQDNLDEFVAVNRDFYDYRFMYSITGTILQLESSDREASQSLRELRLSLVKANQQFDIPLYRIIGSAEERMGQILQSQAFATSSLVQAAGSTSQDIFGFWVVLAAARAAWAQKLGAEDLQEQEMSLERVKVLQDIAKIYQTQEALMQPDILLMEKALTMIEEGKKCQLSSVTLGDIVALDPAINQPQFIRQVGVLLTQLKNHQITAYNPLMQELRVIYDFLMHGQVMPLQAIQAPEGWEPVNTQSTMKKIFNLAMQRGDTKPKLPGPDY